METMFFSINCNKDSKFPRLANFKINNFSRYIDNKIKKGLLRFKYGITLKR